MARLLSPGDAYGVFSFVVAGKNVQVAKGAVATVYADEAGTVLANIAAYDPDNPSTPGTVISGSQLIVNAYSELPRFWLPDGAKQVWVTIGGGPLTAVPADLPSRVTGLEATVAADLSAAEAYTDAAVAAEAAARAAAVTAEASSRASGDTSTLSSANTYTDTAVAGEATARAAAITSEAASRTAGDAASVATAQAYTDGAIAGEASTRATIDATKAPLTRSIATTAPLQGGGDLSADRTLTVASATSGAVGVVQLTGDLAGTATAPTVPGLASKVPTTRAITAGTGLTGGGDLSADRTLAVAYGTSAGTAAQGNDTRITGALQSGSNLSDVGSPDTSRTNLHAEHGLFVSATQTTSFTAAAGVVYLVDATSGSVTVTLPVAGDKLRVGVKRIDSSANTVTLQRQGSDTINASATTATLVLADEVLNLTANGSGQWWITSGQKSVSSLDGRFVKRGEQRISVIDPGYGADNTGATDCGTALQAAATAAAAAGVPVFFPPGTYKTSTTLVITSDCETTAGASISYIGTGTAVQVGTDSSGVTLNWKRVALPEVVFANKPSPGWTAGTVGVYAVNLNRAWLDIRRIRGFETGLLMYGKGQGTAYVTCYIGHLHSNKVNLQLNADGSGWCNQNTFVGGSWSHDSAEGTNVAGTRHIVLSHITGNADPNTNTWICPSLESPSVVEYTLDVSGAYNVWVNPRFEWTGGHSKVIWQATATRNWIIGGNDIDALAETWVAGAGTNSIVGTTSGRTLLGLDKGQVLENTGSSNSAAITLLRAGGTTAGDNPSTAYTGRFQSSLWRGKRFGDSFDRVQVDPVNGKVLVGDGTAAPTIQWSQGTGTPEGSVTANVGSLYSRNNGASGTTLYVKESGSGNTGWSAMKPTIPRLDTAPSSATPTPNADADDVFELSALAVSATFAAPTGTPKGGQPLIIHIKDNGSAQTLAWNSVYRAVGVVLPATTVAGKNMYVGMRYNAVDSKWDVLAVSQE